MRKQIDRIIGSFLVVLMAIMLFAVLWQVFTRYIIGSASTFTEELARFLLIWIGLLGAAYASGQKMHLAIDLLPSQLTGRKKRILASIISIVIILFSATVLVAGGGQLVYTSYILGQTSAALQIPLAYVYAVIPLSGLLVIYYKIMDLKNSKPALKTNKETPDKSGSPVTLTDKE